MRKAGAVVYDVLSKLKKMSAPGVTTARLNEAALDMTAQSGGEALFRGVKGPGNRLPFPGAICTSINEQIVHGIPSPGVVLAEGDILSIDYGIRLGGYCADAAVTFGIGKITGEKQRLLDVTREALQMTIAEAAPNVRWSRIAGHIQNYVESVGFSVIRDFVGHGIGTKMHEEPRLPNFVSEEMLADDVVLKEGMVLATEPMVSAGDSAVRTLGDSWTVVTRDGKCSAHFEHTIAIVKGGCQVLTLPLN
jgi:methionyl aminopeptidase